MASNHLSDTILWAAVNQKHTSFNKPVMLRLDASVCVCYQTMWQSADITVCVVAQTPTRLPLSLSLLLSVSLSRLRPASRKRTDVKRKPRPLMHPAFVLSLTDSCVWIVMQNLQPDVVNTSVWMSVCLFVWWGKRLSHMKGRTNMKQKRTVNHSLTEKVRTGREKDSFSLL